MPAPLAGRRVLDLGALCAQRPHALAVSMAAKLCGAYGAELVRPVPTDGEPFATLPPLLPGGGSALDRFLNDGKRPGPASGRFDAAIGDTAALARHAADVPVKARISVFGPGADPPMTELGLLALSGLLGIVGDPPPAPPTPLAGHQAAYAAGLAACTGLLAALRAGGDEIVDVSLFDVCVWLNWKSAADMLVIGSVPIRGATAQWFTVAAKDGHVALVYQDKDWPQLRALIGDARLADERFAVAPLRGANRAALTEIIGPWFAARTRAEITAAAQARRVPIGPVKFPAELLTDAHYRARNFLAPDGTPALPLAWDDRALPLVGIRVVDLGAITAGAGTSALLLDLGATVVKVEGPAALDSFRSWDGADPTTDWWNRSHQFNFTNRGKQSLCLDLKDARGRDALLRLLENADVLVENFRRGVMASLGLGLAMLRQRFPRLVIASISSQGETGPDRDMVSYGSTLEATGGLAALTGAGVAPVITGRAVNYPDQVVCLFASGAIVAALMERDRTGEAAHLDLSQRELTSFLVGEELIAAAAGAPSARHGNTDPAEPAERIIADNAGERVEWSGGGAPVRNGAALIAAAEFTTGTAIMRCPDGSPAKGVPFRFATRSLIVKDGCHALGADNHAVLTEAGLTGDEVAALQKAGLLATAPRK